LPNKAIIQSFTIGEIFDWQASRTLPKVCVYIYII